MKYTISKKSSSDDSSRRKITEIHDMVKSLLLKLHKSDSAIGEELLEGGGS